MGEVKLPVADTAGDRVSWLAVSSPAVFVSVADEARLLTELERPFALVLVIDAVELDRHRRAFPQMRHLPGGRARFGAWCRGVAYVFGSVTVQLGAHVHLEHAPRVWGVRVYQTCSRRDATLWLAAQFDRCRTACG